MHSYRFASYLVLERNAMIYLLLLPVFTSSAFSLHLWSFLTSVNALINSLITSLMIALHLLTTRMLRLYKHAYLKVLVIDHPLWFLLDLYLVTGSCFSLCWVGWTSLLTYILISIYFAVAGLCKHVTYCPYCWCWVCRNRVACKRYGMQYFYLIIETCNI